MEAEQSRAVLASHTSDVVTTIAPLCGRMGALRWSASPPWMTNPRMSIVYAHIWSAPPSLHCMAAGVPCDPTSQVSLSRRAAGARWLPLSVIRCRHRLAQ